MGSIRGFRCEWCHAEVLAMARQPGLIARTPWSPPVRCCGRPLRPLETGQVLAANLPRRRVARCPRCGYEVCVVIHPVRALVCALCEAEFVMGDADAAAPVPGGATLSGGASRR